MRCRTLRELLNQAWRSVDGLGIEVWIAAAAFGWGACSFLPACRHMGLAAHCPGTRFCSFCFDLKLTGYHRHPERRDKCLEPDAGCEDESDRAARRGLVSGRERIQ